jgi:hypothetical protein
LVFRRTTAFAASDGLTVVTEVPPLDQLLLNRKSPSRRL